MPAVLEPSATVAAPVSVARSIIKSGLSFCALPSASAKTSLPSASVFRTSIVFPPKVVTTSLGL